ncbi:hypothetical protein [Methyloceanibacter sp.]|uniref:hypothetical protein n=1 Tax=Methyloceanibacter sp. TaxID=1965321 RepID=UPI002B66D78D|nr:hypothetical protein [Methyloceanibacter sp.]HML92385.1 hypothetical protein [Methyloceanibacter sp.]
MSEKSPLQDSVNVFVDWAKSRLDEMSANAATLQDNLDKLDATTRSQAEQAVTQLKQWIQQGQDDVKAAQDQGQAAVAQAKADMEALWSKFQNGSGNWAELVQDQQALFQARAQAQMQAWQDAANTYMKRLNDVQEQHRSQAEAQVAEFKAQAQKAQADLNSKMDELAKAGQTSWAAMSQALDQSRDAFTKSMEMAAKNFNDIMKG